MFRPLKKVEKKVRKNYQAAIFSKYKQGQYVGREKVGEILKFSFAFYEKILETHLNKIASIELLAYLLSEYDEYFDLSIRHQHGQLTKEEEKFWNEDGNKSKRAIKYILEKIINYLPNEIKDGVEFLESLSYCLIAAEEMVSSYMSDDLAYSLSPDDCAIEIKNKTSHNFLEFKPNPITDIINNINSNQYFIKRDNYISENGIQLPLENAYQAKILDDVFLESFNLSYSDSIGVISELISICEPRAGGVNSCGFNKKSMTLALVEDRKNRNVTKEQIETILNGFCLSSSNLYQRKIFSPKQEYRAFKRGFFEVPTNKGCFILFSKKMALESLVQLQLSACFGQLPTEWLAFNKNIKNKLASLSNSTGKWFEDLLSNEYRSRGINYIQSLKKLKINGENIYIPDGIGEIDFLAIIGSELHVVECKFVQFSSEPRHYLDDKSKFIKGDKSYSEKFIRKINWVSENIDIIKQHLNSLDIPASKIESIRPYIVTFYPTIAKGLIHEHECVDFIEYFENSL